MNFHKDPLIERLRIIEARTLSEALSDDEFAELQKLRAELGDDTESAKLHSEADAVIKARAADFEKSGDSTSTVKWPTTPEEIKAFQKANNLQADGLIGQKTMAALVAAGATPPAGFKPVGNKVKPTEKPPGQAAKPTPTTQAGIPPELLRAIPSPKEGDQYWVNGTRYEFRSIYDGRQFGKPQWTVEHKPGDFAFKADTEWAAKNKFTGTPAQANAQFMQKTYPKPQAESTEIDRLKELLKF